VERTWAAPASADAGKTRYELSEKNRNSATTTIGAGPSTVRKARAAETRS
jgi:hypothetical protein